MFSFYRKSPTFNKSRKQVTIILYLIYRCSVFMLYSIVWVVLVAFWAFGDASVKNKFQPTLFLCSFYKLQKGCLHIKPF